MQNLFVFVTNIFYILGCAKENQNRQAPGSMSTSSSAIRCTLKSPGMLRRNTEMHGYSKIEQGSICMGLGTFPSSASRSNLSQTSTFIFVRDPLCATWASTSASPTRAPLRFAACSWRRFWSLCPHLWSTWPGLWCSWKGCILCLPLGCFGYPFVGKNFN